MSASKDARKALERGRDALEKQRTDEAAKELRRAVELHPDYAVAWFEQGSVLVTKGRQEDGRKALEMAMKADQKYLNPYPVLAPIAFNVKKWEDLAGIR